MNVTQLCATPLRIRIEQNAGSGGGSIGQDFTLSSIDEDQAVFVAAPAEPVSNPPGDPNG